MSLIADMYAQARVFPSIPPASQPECINPLWGKSHLPRARMSLWTRSVDGEGPACKGCYSATVCNIKDSNSGFQETFSSSVSPTETLWFHRLFMRVKTLQPKHLRGRVSIILCQKGLLPLISLWTASLGVEFYWLHWGETGATEDKVYLCGNTKTLHSSLQWW